MALGALIRRAQASCRELPCPRLPIISDPVRRVHVRSPRPRCCPDGLARVHHHFAPLHNRRSLNHFQLPRRLVTSNAAGPLCLGRDDVIRGRRAVALPFPRGIASCSVASTIAPRVPSRPFEVDSFWSLRFGPDTARHSQTQQDTASSHPASHVANKHTVAACRLLHRRYRHQENAEAVERQVADELSIQLAHKQPPSTIVAVTVQCLVGSAFTLLQTCGRGAPSDSCFAASGPDRSLHPYHGNLYTLAGRPPEQVTEFFKHVQYVTA